MEGDINIILSRFRHHRDPYLGSSLEIHILNLLSFAGFEWAAAPYKMIPLEETGLLHRLRLRNGCMELIKIKQEKQDWTS